MSSLNMIVITRGSLVFAPYENKNSLLGSCLASRVWTEHPSGREQTMGSIVRVLSASSDASHHRELGAVTFKTYKKFNIHKQWDIRL